MFVGVAVWLFERAWFDVLSAVVDADLRSEIRSSMETLARENQRFAVDLPSRIYVRLAALVLASDRLLRERLPDEERRVLLEEAMLEACRRGARSPMRLALSVSRDRVALMRRLAPSPGRASVLGRGWNITHESEVRDGADVFEFIVTDCFLSRLFTENGEPQLAYLFCHGDLAWSDEIAPDRHGMRFERPGTIATGAPRCTFRFTRVG